MCSCVCVSVRLCVRASVRPYACVSMCVCACVYQCADACTRVCVNLIPSSLVVISGFVVSLFILFTLEQYRRSRSIEQYSCCLTPVIMQQKKSVTKLISPAISLLEKLNKFCFCF